MVIQDEGNRDITNNLVNHMNRHTVDGLFPLCKLNWLLQQHLLILKVAVLSQILYFFYYAIF